ncbi:MAG: DUF6382 domain-containing protein, partial [Bifidobacteriaceae bacterium]|nr:DUF6382 domain-containing protein [Bifidobacteriaceae bacterium]
MGGTVYELTYHGSGGQSYLCCDVPTGSNLERRTLNAQLVNDVPGLVKLSLLDKYGAEQLRYNITSRMQLTRYLQAPVLESSLVALARSLVNCWRGLRRFQVQPNCVVLDPDYVFVVPAELTCELICVPLVQ